MVGEPIDFISVDVSFISLTLVLPVAKTYLRDKAEMVCLIKPQFEAGRENVGKKGVVRDKDTHIEVINNIIDFAYETGFSVLNLDFSPIRGPEGNIEYLVYLSKASDKQLFVDCNKINDIVAKSHTELSGE
jgi:23S rRNA (cytidine1920-2'-O)/16S rRNA (cytidine1409-2'-O)-methyltransferase